MFASLDEAYLAPGIDVTEAEVEHLKFLIS